MSTSLDKQSEIFHLRQIVCSNHNEEEQLLKIKEFEVSKTLKKFEIFTRLQDLVPLATSLVAIRQIVSTFTRKLVALLDELNILEDVELSKSAIKAVKTFWSICSSQQNSVSTSQLFGKWDTELLDVMTPLASILIDFSITAYRKKDNQELWAKRLYSWLNFDLPDRAIKVALLEVTGSDKDGAEVIVGPLVSKVLLREIDEESSPEYLLQFVLLRKWKNLKDAKALFKHFRSLKAPKPFLGWLKSHWKHGDEFIPDDKSLKGSAISQFLLDLNTDEEEFIQSLIDVLQMTIFPEDVQNGNSVENVDAPMFVVDKKGVENNKDSLKGEKVKAKTGKKRRVAEILEQDAQEVVNVESGEDNGVVDESMNLSQKRKKRKVENTATSVNQDENFGFVLDRGPVKKISSVIEVDDSENGDRDIFEGSDLEMEVEESAESSDVQLIGVDLGKTKKGIVERKGLGAIVEVEDSEKGSSDDEGSLMGSCQNGDDDSSSVAEVSDNEADDDTDDVVKSKPLIGNLAAAVLKKKNILISDPVSSSYFSPGTNGSNSDIQIVEVTDTDSIASQQSSPVKLGSADKIINVKLNKASEGSERVKSPQKKTVSGKKDGEIQIVEVTDTDYVSSPSKLGSAGKIMKERHANSNSKKATESPKKLKSPEKVSRSPEGDSPRKSKSPRKSPKKFSTDEEPSDYEHIKQVSKSIMSLDKQSNVVDDDNDNDMSMEVDDKTKSVYFVNNVEMEGKVPGVGGKGMDKSFQDTIASKIAAIRKSAQSPQATSKSTPKAEMDTPTRRSTRLRTDSNKNDSAPPKTSSSLLKDWLRSPTSKRNDEDDNTDSIVSESASSKSMTKIKDRKSVGDDNDELESVKTRQSSPKKMEQNLEKSGPQWSEKKEMTVADVFLPKKTYLKRDRKSSEKITDFMETQKTPKKSAKVVSEINKAENEDDDVKSVPTQEEEAKSSGKIASKSSSQRRKSEPPTSSVKTRLIQTSLTPGIVSLKEKSKRSPADEVEADSDDKPTVMMSTRRKSTTTATSKTPTSKTPSTRSKTPTTKTPKSQGETTPKKGSPSPGTSRRKSLRSSKK